MRAIDVANYFIANSTEDDALSNMKLNKLLYFAQGWSLARTGKPLFDDGIEAWQYGPVVPEVYRRFSPCGKHSISQADGMSCNLSADEYELLEDILTAYNGFTASKLMHMTHGQAPWKDVYKPYANNPISQDALKSYFSAQPPLPKTSRLPRGTEEVITKTSKNGHPVFPMDWDDPEDAVYDEI